jgi:hypothetical protein
MVALANHYDNVAQLVRLQNQRTQKYEFLSVGIDDAVIGPSPQN